MKSARILVAGAVLSAAPLTACSGGGDVGPEQQVDASALVQVTPAGSTNVDPALPVVITAQHGGHLTDVTVVADGGRQVAGKLAADGASWRSTGPLAAGTHYTVKVQAADGDGTGRGGVQKGFTTLTAAATLTATLTPGDKAVYGVGEPITVALSHPVHDQAARQVVERGLSVRSTPSVTGSWYWVDDSTLHFRPKDYWPTHATVQASFDLGGAKVQDGLYGGAPAAVGFRTGDKMFALTDAGSDYMSVYRNGEKIRSIPITTGKPGFSTRNGIKVVLEQQQEVFMNSSTVGIAADSPNAYHLDVYWDTRVTWSGEYVHAAPWSEGSQGVSNVSHGCTGMSTGNAEWFYDNFRRGDIVQVVNSLGHQMEPFGNGFGDWNLAWSDWIKGSALGRTVTTQPATTDPANAPAAGAAASVASSVGYLRPRA
ncbi:L,D-transpeptidase [Streptacidiphilus jiangxiensis]|uniref:Lipoprotein-anchoring transpeptidase ErfK/SrfK n=1 Tax=Streptacidiphilus jiangxiensis TaxID=235985 RepID=A0A1H7STN8_STRJI|nr:Ig-like domain-containing protein [Streptacidiphilus jiangxiensis]SEL75689.1 Lipoprotein-anchoring transpeptidase ErfK/SrfK [Streptacidiphilus jiangxiensis]